MLKGKFLFLLVIKIKITSKAWTPYATVALIGAFGNKALLTPGVTMIPACACKFVACLDPYVYAISHPRYRYHTHLTITKNTPSFLTNQTIHFWYRIELQKRLPWLAIIEKEEKPNVETASNVTTEASQAPSS